MSDAVVVRGLGVSFDAVHAVTDLDLTVHTGGAVALVGRNGAGKSTTLRILAGVLPADAGSVNLCGVDVRTSPMAARRLVGYCPDVGGLVPRATPWEHLQLAARLRAMSDWQDTARLLLEQFDLAEAADRVTAGFSHGMCRRLCVVLAAFHSPRVLLLDEPFDGVDPLGVEATLDLVARLREQGSAVLLSTHLVDLALRACDEAVVLRGGRIVAASAASSLLGADSAQETDRAEQAARAARYRALLT